VAPCVSNIQYFVGFQKKLDKSKDAKPNDFPSEYDPMQVSAHEDAVSPFERYAKGGDNAKLEDWAGKTLPTLQHHLQMAEQMNRNRASSYRRLSGRGHTQRFRSAIFAFRSPGDGKRRSINCAKSGTNPPGALWSKTQLPRGDEP
jgi:hypothetical protein